MRVSIQPDPVVTTRFQECFGESRVWMEASFPALKSLLLQLAIVEPAITEAHTGPALGVVLVNLITGQVYGTPPSPPGNSQRGELIAAAVLAELLTWPIDRRRQLARGCSTEALIAARSVAREVQAVSPLPPELTESWVVERCVLFVECRHVALGLDGDAADVALALLPTWAGTVDALALAARAVASPASRE